MHSILKPTHMSYVYDPYQYSSQPVYTIYYLNNMPYVNYAQQPDILYPCQQVETTPEPSRGIASDLVAGVGDVLQNNLQYNVNTLEDYVKKMEQQAAEQIIAKAKSSRCFTCFC